MNMQNLAMVAFLMSGVYVVVSVCRWMMGREGGPTMPSVFVMILGVAMIGVGGFGPAFLSDYAELVRALRGIEETSDDEDTQQANVQNVVNEFANGSFRDEDWALIAATIKENPVRDLSEILDAAAANAPPDRRELIRTTRDDIERFEDTLRPALTLPPEVSQDEAALERHLKKLDRRSLRVIELEPQIIQGVPDATFDENIRDAARRIRRAERGLPAGG